MMPESRPRPSRIIRRQAIAAVVCLLGLSWLSSALATDVELKAGYIPAAPSSAKVLAGYMTLHNRTTQPIALTGASSAAFERIELHRSVRQGSMVRMEQLGRIEIPAQGALEFKPGGYHLMLIGPRHPLSPGQAVPVVLQFDNGKTISSQLMAQAVHLPGQHPSQHQHPGRIPEP